MLSNPIILTVLIATPLLLVSGGWMFRVALRGVRRGDTRFCATCGYDLTGGSGDVCSECGRELNVPGAVVVGIRHVRRGLLSVSLLTLLLAVGVGTVGGVVVSKNITWYSVAPLYFVLRDAQCNDPSIVLNALREIARRESTTPFSMDDASRIADGLIPRLGGKTPASARAADLLSDFEVTDRLTEIQRTAFIDNSMRFEITARSPVFAGREIPVAIKFESDLPIGRYRCRREYRDFRIGSNPPENYKISSSHELLGNRQEDTVYLHASAAGPQFVSATVEYSLFRNSPSGALLAIPQTFAHAKDRSVVLNYRKQITANILLLAEGDSDPLIRLYDRSLGDKLQQCFRPSGLTAQETDHEDAGFALTGYVAFVKATPVSVAFDVVVRDQDIDYPAGKFTLKRGVHDTVSYGFQVSHWNRELVGPVTVVLRSNPSVAEETTDTFEMWVGELVYPDVPVGDNRLPPPEPDYERIIESSRDKKGKP